MNPVTNVNLAAYLVTKNFQVTDTETMNGMVTFYFPEEVEDLILRWENHPDEDMRLVQKFASQKERLFQIIKNSRSRSEYGNWR